VQKVQDSGGDTVYQHKKAPTRALDPKVANDVTLTLMPVAAWSNDPLSGGRPSAAKTGTEGIPGTTANSDAWMVGYTPQVSAAVWAGSGNSTKPIYNAGGGPEYGSDLPGRTWRLFMDTYLTGKPNMPMATKQLIAGGADTAPVPTPTTPTPTKTPTPTRTTGPTTTTPPPPVTSSTTQPPPTTPTPSPTCITPIIGNPACPTPTLTPTSTRSKPGG
jgi:membrane peptidoglycan carboxypeptidase